VVYIPQQVRFRLVGTDGYFLEGVSVSATPINFSAPSNWTSILLGINDNVGITGTTVSGTTSSDGSWVAPMLQSIQYNMTSYRASDIDYTMTIHPEQTDYTLTIPVGVVAIPTSAANVITYSVQNATVDATHQYFNMSYEDTSGGTNALVFYVYNTSSKVLVSSAAYSGAAANDQTYSALLGVVEGNSYTYGVSANQSEYGWINQTSTMTLSYDTQIFANMPSWVKVWFSVGIIVIFAALFSLYSRALALIAIPILTWYFQFVLKTLPSTFLSTIALGTMLTIGVLVYIRQQENTIQ